MATSASSVRQNTRYVTDACLPLAVMGLMTSDAGSDDIKNKITARASDIGATTHHGVFVTN